MNWIRFEYFFNAIYYCLRLYNKKEQMVINKLLGIIFYPIWLIMPKKCKMRFRNNLAAQQEDINAFFNDKKKGVQINLANRHISAVCCLYISFIPFVIWGFILKFYGEFNLLIAFVVLFPPIWIADSPLRRGVFKNDRYIKYFNKFEKKMHNGIRNGRGELSFFALEDYYHPLWV